MATDISHTDSRDFPCKLFIVDVLHHNRLEKVIADNKVNTIIHLAAMLLMSSEKQPEKAMQINIRGLENVIDLALKHKCQLFNASSIAAYGGNFQRDNASEDSPLVPDTIYGISKIYGELLGRYYNIKRGLDYRSLRFPVVVSTDQHEYKSSAAYASEIFNHALTDKRYECYVAPETRVPLLHVDDCAEATVKLMEADNAKLTRRVYNLAGISVSAGELAEAIKRRVPEFVCTFKPDERQKILDTWPRSLVDSSNKDWGWSYEVNAQQFVDRVFERREQKANELKQTQEKEKQQVGLRGGRPRGRLRKEPQPA